MRGTVSGCGASQPRSAHELERARLDVPGRDTMQRNLGCREVTTEQLVKSKRDDILRVAAQHGARNVRVFGSVARGEADDASDVDFLVEMEPGGPSSTSAASRSNSSRCSVGMSMS